MTTFAEQLPIQLYPTDQQEVTIEAFKMDCPQCKLTLTEEDLEGEVDIHHIDTAKFVVDCTCTHCGARLQEERRVKALKNGKTELHYKVEGKWIHANLSRSS